MEGPKAPENEIKRLEALRATQLLDSPNEAIFDNLTSLVSKYFEVPVVAISLVDEFRQWFKSIQGLDVCETGRDVSFCGHVVFNGSPLVVNDAREDHRFFDNPLVKESPNIVFYAGIPLRFAHQGDVYYLGSLCIIDYEPREFSTASLTTLKQFTFLLESLIETRLPSHKFDSLCRQLKKESIDLRDIEDNMNHLQTASETDLLTELPNRRFLNRVLQDSWYEDKRHKSLCLMVVDLDNFKQVNDQHGHATGDIILKHVAQSLNGLIRIDEDTLCRFGGDEFILLSFNQVLKGLETLANKILAYYISNPPHTDYPDITVSIGGCITSNKQHSFDTLLKSADAQLYKAKAAGKNKFEFEHVD